MSIAVWNTIRLHSSEFHLTDFLLGRVVLGDHALVAEPGSRRRTRWRLGLVCAAVTRARSPESARNRSSATVRITRPTSRNAL